MTLLKEIQQHGLNNLIEILGGDVYGCDLHNSLYNEDYFIIGTHRAKTLMGDMAFDIIGEVQQYELDNFGECNTDFSSPEKVLNMYAYIKGEEFLSMSDTLRENWNIVLVESDLKMILEELEAEMGVE